jgi:hypothetical protein
MFMNLPAPGHDQMQVPPHGGQSGKHLHEERSARQERSDFSAKNMGSIILRFVGLLLAAILALALIWSR